LWMRRRAEVEGHCLLLSLQLLEGQVVGIINIPERDGRWRNRVWNECGPRLAEAQSDLPGGRAEGLNEALGLLSGVEGVAVAHFSDKDVVRHPLVTRIVRAYNSTGKDTNGGRKAKEIAE